MSTTPSAARFSVSVPRGAVHLQAIRAFFRAVLQERCASETEALILALDESCANLLKHQCEATAGDRLCVHADLEPGRVQFRIDDFCSHAEVDRIQPRPIEQVRPGGLGTHFVRTIMDRVEFEPQPGRPGRMCLVLEKALPISAVPATRKEAEHHA